MSITTASPACDQRRGRAGAIDAVALGERGRHVREGRGAAARGVRGIGRAPAGALLRRRVEKDLHVRGREHDRPDVAPFHHDAPLPAKLALPRDERLAHARLARDDRRRRVHLGGPDRRRDVVAVDANSTVAGLEPGLGRQRRHGRLVGQIDPVVPRLPRQRAVHRAGVDVAVAEPRRDRARDRAFAGAGRTVDGDDEGPLARPGFGFRGPGSGRSMVAHADIIHRNAPQNESLARPRRRRPDRGTVRLERLPSGGGVRGPGGGDAGIRTQRGAARDQRLRRTRADDPLARR